MASWMVGVDTGGTFTDLVAFNKDSGEIKLAKVPSYPPDPSQAVLGGVQELSRLGVDPADIQLFAHGTTVGTNAVLEYDGARTGLLITKGFRATYEAQGWIQPDGSDLVDPAYQKPRLLVPQYLTEEVIGRLDYKGEEITPLDEADLRQSVRRLKERGVEAIAVCFLFSYLNDAHEQRAAEIIREEASDVRISLSSEVLPVIREYPRLSTTVIDAYVGPKVEGYLHRLDAQLTSAGVTTAQKFLMQSNGGLMRITIAARHPNQTLLSGPAAGVIAATELARLADCHHVLTFDMGGTSADIGVIVGGQILESSENRIASHDIATPMLKIRTLGAGGGTIAEIGKDGLLKVGPESSGSMPGPVCYGRGGTQPTVTDSNLVIGSLSPGSPLAGNLKLDEAAARTAIQDMIADPLGLEMLEAASGIIRIVNTQMAVDLRTALREQGQDARQFTLMPFGGAGPLHACYLARAANISTILVPVYPGINCATGLLQTQVRHSYLRSAIGTLSGFPAQHMNELFAGLEQHAMVEAAEEGFDRSAVILKRQIDLRYPHQGYALGVECPNGEIHDENKAAIRMAFDELHERIYGQSADEDPEMVTFRVTSEISVPTLQSPSVEAGNGDPSAALTGRRQLYDVDLKQHFDAGIYDRKSLRAGDVIQGPAIIDQYDSTTVILSDFTATVEPAGMLLIKRRHGS
jgi:N-methylhydantoinase A